MLISIIIPVYNEVNTIEEITDVLLALSKMACPKGRRVAIVGRGGGIGVIATDICERAGLTVPPFSIATRRQLEDIIPEAGRREVNNRTGTRYGGQAGSC